MVLDLNMNAYFIFLKYSIPYVLLGRSVFVSLEVLFAVSILYTDFGSRQFNYYPSREKLNTLSKQIIIECPRRCL